MTELFGHNDWANDTLLAACAELTDEQLDAVPLADSPWSVRHALAHLVESQCGYAAILDGTAATPVGASFAELREAAATSGGRLREHARDASRLKRRIATSDGYEVAAWVVLVQAINHGNDHRRQVGGMLRALGVAPPRVDGWGFGEAIGAVVPPTGDS